jgi:hypothetical protein
MLSGCEEWENRTGIDKATVIPYIFEILNKIPGSLDAQGRAVKTPDGVKKK